jgi:hypothetical protein
MKTSELTGAALDWAVLEASGNPSKLEWRKAEYGGLQVRMTVKLLGIIIKDWSAYGPSEIWSQGGPIIERESIDVLRDPNGTAGWGARVYISRRDVWCYGPTPLIAAMRCYCCSKLGDEIDIPEELCQQQNS